MEKLKVLLNFKKIYYIFTTSQDVIYFMQNIILRIQNSSFERNAAESKNFSISLKIYLLIGLRLIFIKETDILSLENILIKNNTVKTSFKFLIIKKTRYFLYFRCFFNHLLRL